MCLPPGMLTFTDAKSLATRKEWSQHICQFLPSSMRQRSRRCLDGGQFINEIKLVNRSPCLAVKEIIHQQFARHRVD